MRIILQPNIQGTKLSKHIQGHFSEHLGNCIYGGLFVGKDSPIENLRGVRSDVVDALKKINAPNMRWPGGCFADEYHWRDGIGPLANRKRMVNNNWGGVCEDNSFGTHEFYDLCEQIGCEPYINGNVGSGSIREMQEWVEYMTCPDDSPMTQLRRANGQDAPWALKYFGVGNENWGGGGNMRPEYYADVYRRYQTYVRNYGDNKVFRIACGPGCGIPNPTYDWTEKLMTLATPLMDGFSLHYYTISGDTWDDKGSATDYSVDEYYKLVDHSRYLDNLLTAHSAIMDRYDPEKRIALIVDEWGTWHAVEPGTNPGFLYQQNTMRDAMVASISLDSLNRHGDRVRMANIAQVANVLQSPILTEGEKMILTPTYHVFDMYKEHQEGTLISLTMTDGLIATKEGDIPKFSASASRSDAGDVHLTLTNIHADESENVSLRLDGGLYQVKSARLLTGEIHQKNTFDEPNAVTIRQALDIKLSYDGGSTEGTFTLPSCAVAAVTLTPVHP